ncbi:Bax inhibitor-1/YccA family protein [Streptococcus sp. DD13]|uniref:Bax inhibitor-1/YccA family protein n=1 Tax=Streptococcus sp. DD13 TaxID=1777881 RepID=UPI00079624C4|nr:Bax inhibitor-1/YccA family protein [Streptococcus sp. DD13]KXT78193.1 membrane protein [Streptococcus sp. DD13]
MNNDRVIINQTEVSALNRFYARVYGFVGLGIGISALVSFLSLTVFQEALLSVLTSGSGRFLVWGLMILEVFLVFSASRAAVRNSRNALPLFIAYSALNGYTLSFILAFYSVGTVTNAFLSATLMFGVMAVVGAVTKRDLSGMARAFYAGLIGIIIASLINMFLGSSGLDFIISIVGVLIFAGLIAYDNQRIRYVFEQTGGHAGQGWVVSLALELYLDFINIFLYLLRIFGSRD